LLSEQIKLLKIFQSHGVTAVPGMGPLFSSLVSKAGLRISGGLTFIVKKEEKFSNWRK
jgi:hypothetical protein